MTSKASGTRLLAIFILITTGYGNAFGSEVEEQAKNAVVSRLKDPDSVRFRMVREFAEVICGEVNAKNSSGGYEGFKQFYFIRKLKIAVIPSGEAITGDLLDSYAKQAEYFCK